MAVTTGARQNNPVDVMCLHAYHKCMLHLLTQVYYTQLKLYGNVPPAVRTTVVRSKLLKVSHIPLLINNLTAVLNTGSSVQSMLYLR